MWDAGASMRSAARNEGARWVAGNWGPGKTVGPALALATEVKAGAQCPSFLRWRTYCHISFAIFECGGKGRVEMQWPQFPALQGPVCVFQVWLNCRIGEVKAESSVLLLGLKCRTPN